MTYCFDLDGTLCTSSGGAYEKAAPYANRIAIVNKLRADGHKIIINTARGFETKINWKNFTKKQLKSWGINYDLLIVGTKPSADVYIDDRAILADLYFETIIP